MKIKINECTVEIDQRKVSKVLHYPDGISRILTLRGSEWAAIDTAMINGYGFEHVLWAAIELSEFRQGDSLPGQDVISCTWFMLMTIIGGIYQKNSPTNDNYPQASNYLNR